MSPEYKVILVYSTSHAIRLENVLKAMGVECKLVPVPRHLDSDCGVCVRVARADAEAASLAIKASRLETAGIHDL